MSRAANSTVVRSPPAGPIAWMPIGSPTDPTIIARAGFGVIDHVGRALCRDGDGNPVQGWGLFEHGALGRHDPSGFADWSTLAP